MNIKVRDYLQDLSKLNIPRRDGIILLDEESEIFSNRKGTEYGWAYLINLNNQKYYIKYHRSEFSIDDICVNTESICSDVYNDLGVNCVDYYPISVENYNNLWVICQDLKSLDDFEVCHSFEISNYIPMCKYICEDLNDSFNYWAIARCKDLLVGTDMTEECYNELLNLLLVDIATTQRDRNPANLFLYKGKNDKLWQGVICIDNGRTLQNENYHCFGQENLTIKELATRLWNNDNIITYGGIKTLQNEHSRSSLPDIITQTNNLIQDGTFNKSQIDIIKKIKEYDISKTIDKTENSKHLKVDSKQKDLMKYMWEKVQNSFEL